MVKLPIRLERRVRAGVWRRRGARVGGLRVVPPAVGHLRNGSRTPWQPTTRDPADFRQHCGHQRKQVLEFLNNADVDCVSHVSGYVRVCHVDRAGGRTLKFSGCENRAKWAALAAKHAAPYWHGGRAACFPPASAPNLPSQPNVAEAFAFEEDACDYGVRRSFSPDWRYRCRSAAWK